MPGKQCWVNQHVFYPYRNYPMYWIQVGFLPSGQQTWKRGVWQNG